MGWSWSNKKKVLCGLFHKINFVSLSVFIVCQANTSRNLLSGCHYFFPRCLAGLIYYYALDLTIFPASVFISPRPAEEARRLNEKLCESWWSRCFFAAKARDLEKLPCSLVVFPAEILFCKVSRGAIFMKRRLQLFMQKFLLFIKSLKLAAGWKKWVCKKGRFKAVYARHDNEAFRAGWL